MRLSYSQQGLTTIKSLQDAESKKPCRVYTNRCIGDQSEVDEEYERYGELIKAREYCVTYSPILP